MKKKLIALVLVCFMFMGCAGFGKFTQSGANTTKNVIAKAVQFLGKVQAVIPVLETLVGLPAFVDEATPFLDKAKDIEMTLIILIDSHTANQTVTTAEAAQVDTVATQITQIQDAALSLNTKLVKMTKDLKAKADSLQAENTKLKAME
jgi:gamma-glutamyl phosphate reductase